MRSDTKKVWRSKVRARIALALGDACGVCGYSTCSQALDYHHVDGKDNRDFAIGVMIRQGIGWDRLVRELRKCVVLCCRCHRELHAGLITLPANIKRFDEHYAVNVFKESARKVRKKKPRPICHCGREVKKLKARFCSQKCRYSLIRKTAVCHTADDGA